MANPYFRFKQFTVYHDRCAMKVTTDACLFGAWVAHRLNGCSGSILDIGTGTGLLSLMLAQQAAGQITAIELDEGAAGQAKENIAASPWIDRIDIIRSDIRSYNANGQYQYIISNPPFYENDLSSPDPAKRMAHHSEGLFVSELLRSTERLLETGGHFYFLLPFRRWGEIEVLLAKDGWYPRHLVTVSQSTKHHPFRLMIEGSRDPATKRVDTSIAIRDGEEYTAGFKNLLRPYYLYL